MTRGSAVCRELARLREQVVGLRGELPDGVAVSVMVGARAGEDVADLLASASRWLPRLATLPMRSSYVASPGVLLWMAAVDTFSVASPNTQTSALSCLYATQPEESRPVAVAVAALVRAVAVVALVG